LKAPVPHKKPTGPVKLDFSFVTSNPPVAKNSQFSAYPTRALAVLKDERVGDNVAMPIGAPVKFMVPPDEPVMLAQSISALSPRTV